MQHQQQQDPSSAVSAILEHAKKQGYEGEQQVAGEEEDPSKYLTALLQHAKSKGFSTEEGAASAMDTDK